MEPNYYPYQKGQDGYFHLGTNSLATIRNHVTRTSILYEDPEFPPSHQSIFGGGGSSEIRWQGNILWKRPGELVQYPQFIADGVSRFDVIQGELGNCWLIAAVANLTMHPSLFAQVVPIDNGTFRPGEYCGAFHFRFWQYGNWVDIIVDDRLPCNRNGELLFLHSSDSREFWGALLEKAYAKMHGSYASLSGGTPSEALQDFSGGIIEAIDIDIGTPHLFSLMQKAYNRSSLMSCSLSGRGGRYEERTRDGLVKGHAYSVTAVNLIPVTSGYRGSGAPLVRIRNPWGDNFEWKGAWSDGSREWSLVHPSVKAQFGVTNRNDGEFWMSIDDFQTQFTRLEICHLSPDPIDAGIKQYGRPWDKQVIWGSWIRGATAGGCLNHRTFDQNPQYFFHFEASAEDGDADKCTVIVGLLQKRPKRSTTNAATRKAQCIGFRMYKVNAYYSPGEKLDFGFFKRPGLKAFTSGDFIDSREVSARFEVPTGNYVLVPSTYDPNEEGEFLLRIFSEPSSRPAPQQYTVQQYASQHGGIVDGPMMPQPQVPVAPPPASAPSFPPQQPQPAYNPYPPAAPLPPQPIMSFPNPYATSAPSAPAVPQYPTPFSTSPYPNSTPGNIPAYPIQPSYNMPSYPPAQPQAPQYPGGAPQYHGSAPQYPGGAHQQHGSAPQYPGGAPLPYPSYSSQPVLNSTPPQSHQNPPAPPSIGFVFGGPTNT